MKALRIAQKFFERASVRTAQGNERDFGPISTTGIREGKAT
jgi:hypothetical protein